MIERDSPAVLLTVGLAGFVAASHLVAAVGIFPYSPWLSAALALVALAAGGWAVRVARRPSRGLLLAGAGAAGALVALWVWTRTAGVPFVAGGPSPVGVLDALTAFDELLLAWFALGAAREGRDAPRHGAAPRRAPRHGAAPRRALRQGAAPRRALRHGRQRRPAERERWPLVGCVAISVSFIALAMGCEPAAPADAADGSPAPALICHLY